MRLTLLLSIFWLCFSHFQQKNYNTNTFKDLRDGHLYNTVEIAGLEWMSENLNYRITGSMCYDDHPFNCRRLGRLYTWWDAKQSCPEGWRLPSDKDWDKLYYHYGGNTIDAYNNMVSGLFKAKMGGWYSQNEKFEALKKRAYFWSSTTKVEGEEARYYSLNKANKLLNSSSTKKSLAFSCRCVRDIVN